MQGRHTLIKNVPLHKFGCHHTIVPRLADCPIHEDEVSLLDIGKDLDGNTCQRLDKPDTLYSNTRRIARYQLSVLLLLCYCEGWHMLNSAVTVCRRLRSAELRVRWPYFGPFFVSVTSRSQFTLVTASLTVAITTMACCRLWWFHMRNADGRMQVWRRCGERCNNDCVVQTGRLGWGICLGYEKGRMNAQYYNVFPDVIQICTRLGMSMLDCIQHVTLWTSWTETM